MADVEEVDDVKGADGSGDDGIDKDKGGEDC